jgi:hypothetical protein
MSLLSRLFDFSPGTTIRSSEVDSEFDQLVKLLNGIDVLNSLYLGGTSLPNPASIPKLFVSDGQFQISLSASGRAIAIYKDGESTPRVDLLNTGQIRVVASQQSVTPSTQLMVLMGSLVANGASVGNVGGGEDTLHSFIMGAQVLSTNKTYARVRKAGFTAANGNNKQLKFKVTTTSGTTIIAATGVITENNKPWFLECDIQNDPDGVSQIKVDGRLVCGATEVRFNSVVTGFDFTVNNTFFITGEAVADNDIVQTKTIVEKGFGIN